MVDSLSPTEPIFFGFTYESFIQNGFTDKNTRILSKKAVRAFIEEGVKHDGCNSSSEEIESIKFMRCMNVSGVQVHDSRDELGRERYLELTHDLQETGDGASKRFITVRIFFELKSNKRIIFLFQGFEKKSNVVAVVDYVSEAKKFVLEYLIHHLKLGK